MKGTRTVYWEGCLIGFGWVRGSVEVGRVACSLGDLSVEFRVVTSPGQSTSRSTEGDVPVFRVT